MELPSYEALVKANTALAAENAYLRKVIEELRAEISNLKAQLNLDSKTSSKPPSTDQKSNLPKTKKNGIRSYHKGVSRQLLPESEVTSKESRQIDQCPNCSSKMVATDDVRCWQQIELPKIKALVHQIDLIETKCPCCRTTVRPKLLPAEQFLLGPRLEALTNILLGQYRQGHRPARTIISTILPGVELSQGLISKIKLRAATALSGPYEELMSAIVESEDPLHIDATGWRHAGSTEHALVLRVGSLIIYAIRSHQNGSVISTLLNGRVTKIVSDRGLACSKIEVKIKQYCLAHLLRNIAGQAAHPATTCKDTQSMGEIYDSLQELFIDKHRAMRKEISESTWKQYGYAKWAYIKNRLEDLKIHGSTKKLRRFCR